MLYSSFYVMYTTVQKLRVTKIFILFKNNIFMQQRCIKSIKSDIKDINTLQKISNKCCSLESAQH